MQRGPRLLVSLALLAALLLLWNGRRREWLSSPLSHSERERAAPTDDVRPTDVPIETRHESVESNGPAPATIEPERPTVEACIVVFDVLGDPLEGVEVVVTRDDSPWHARGLSDDAGLVLLPDVGDALGRTITFAAAGTDVWPHRSTGELRELQSITVPRAVMVDVDVEDARGKPIRAGVRVVPHSNGLRGAMNEVATGDDGRVRIAVPADQKTSIQCRAEGHVPAQIGR